LTRLSLERLDGPFDLQAEEGIVTAGAGVRLTRLRDEGSARGKRTLLETPYPGATVGGTVATDAFPAALTIDRRLRNDLLGIQVALPSGTLARAGGRVVKNVTGYDLVRLHCGACGTLGVITEVTVRLRPGPESRRILTRQSPSVDEAFRLAGNLLESRVEPAGSAICIADGDAILVWVLEGSEADVRARAGRLEGDSVEPSVWDGIDRSVASVPPDAHARLRLMGRATDSSALWRWLERAGGKPTLALPLMGLVFGELPEAVVPQQVGAARESGTTILIEHGSPGLKGRVDALGPAPDSLPVMRALKARFDPRRVLAPGRAIGRL
jgi:glycolate oxidase FAD binding subunit